MREINILIVTDHWQGTRNKKLNWSTLVDCTQERLYYNSMKKQLDTLSPKDKKFLMERVLEEDILKRLKELEK